MWSTLWSDVLPVCVCVCVAAADTEDVCIVERLFSSSLVAIVSLKAPRKLKVCHFKKGTEICNYSYSNTILAVKLNRQVGGRGQRHTCPSHSSLMWPASPRHTVTKHWETFSLVQTLYFCNKSMSNCCLPLTFFCRGWSCVWRSRFTFTTSGTWKCCTRSEKLHPTPQVSLKTSSSISAEAELTRARVFLKAPTHQTDNKKNKLRQKSSALSCFCLCCRARKCLCSHREDNSWWPTGLYVLHLCQSKSFSTDIQTVLKWSSIF